MLGSMKKQLLLVTCLAAATFVVGCDKSPTAAQQLDTVKTETKQAAQDMKDYAYTQKAEFVKTMQAQLTELNSNLDQLATKIDSSSAAVQAEAKPKLQALRDQAAQLAKQLGEVQNANESTWDSVKAGTQKAYTSVSNSFTEARQWLSEKIAP